MPGSVLVALDSPRLDQSMENLHLNVADVKDLGNGAKRVPRGSKSKVREEVGWLTFDKPKSLGAIQAICFPFFW
jgi:hypothetical protein